VFFFISDLDNKRAGLWLIKLTDWIVQRWSDVSALQVATADAYIANHIMQHIVLICHLVTQML